MFTMGTRGLNSFWPFHVGCFLLHLTAVACTLADESGEPFKCTKFRITAYRQTLNGITFGNLYKLHSSFDGYTVSQAEDDLLIPGNIIYTTNTSMVYSFNPATGEHVLISPSQFEPHGERVKQMFIPPIISSFIQYSKTEIIVSNSTGNCLSLLSRSKDSVFSQQFITFAGKCGEPDGATDGTFLETRFAQPRTIVSAPRTRKIYVVDRGSARQLDLKKRMVSKLFTTGESCWYLLTGALTIDQQEENLYVGVLGSFCSGIIRHNIAEQTCTFLASSKNSESTSCPPDEHAVRGLETMPEIMFPSGNVMLNENTIAVIDIYVFDIIILDLQTGCASAVCLRKRRNLGSTCQEDVCQYFNDVPETVEGSIDSCIVQNPLSLSMSKTYDSILIASTDGILVLPTTLGSRSRSQLPWWMSNLQDLMIYFDDIANSITDCEDVIYQDLLNNYDCKTIRRSVLGVMSCCTFIVTVTSTICCYCQKNPNQIQRREPVEHICEDNSESESDESGSEDYQAYDSHPTKHNHADNSRNDLNQHQERRIITRQSAKLLSQTHAAAKKYPAISKVDKLSSGDDVIKDSLTKKNEHINEEIQKLLVSDGNICPASTSCPGAAKIHPTSITAAESHEPRPVSSYSLRSSYCEAEQPEEYTLSTTE